MKSNTHLIQLTYSSETTGLGDTFQGRQRGFTLIELMITLVVAAVLMAIAIPSFKYLTISNKLTTTANLVVTALNSARMEAVKRNTSVAATCADNSNVCAVVTVPKTAQGATPAVNAVTIISGITTITSPIQMQNGVTLTFSGQGIASSATLNPYDGLVADIFSNDISSDNHRCVYMTTGILVKSCTSSTQCVVGGSANATCK